MPLQGVGSSLKTSRKWPLFWPGASGTTSDGRPWPDQQGDFVLLNLSVQTVKNHMHRMLRKIGANEAAGALEIAAPKSLLIIERSPWHFILPETSKSGWQFALDTKGVSVRIGTFFGTA